MTRLLKAVAVVVAGASAVAAAEVPPIAVPPADARALVEGGNAFAIDLYKKLAAEKGNVVCSPYSVSAALAMTYAGARGETATEMAKVLGFTALGERVHPAQADLARRLKGDSVKGRPEFNVANALWGQRGVEFRPEFLKLTQANYGAGLREVDYDANPEAARDAINGWVRDQTKGKIPKLLLPGMVTRGTRLTLTNAIYFKGSWLHEFPIEGTVDDQFRVSATETVPIRMMNAHMKGLCYEGDVVKAVRLPYQGGGKSMLVVVPDEVEGLAAVGGQLTSAQVKKWWLATTSADVKLQLPKFKARYNVLLGGILNRMGMTRPFGASTADFGGIVEGEKWSISDVVHEAVVEVDEEGTVAAAATAVIMLAPISPPSRPRHVTVRADRPFLFLIVDDATQAIVFVGRVVKP